jgi:hypothetical protein
MQHPHEHNSVINALLNDLSEHTFSLQNLTKISEKLEYSNKKKNIQKKNETYFDPFLTQKDSLFWCFYVLFFGFDKYEMLGNQHFVEEKKIKFQYIDIFRSKKDILKMYKIKPLSEIEDELANKEVIGIKSFVALCIVANLNVMIINKHKYYEIKMNDTEKITIIYQYSQPLKFVMDLESTEEKLNNYRNTFFKLDNLNYKLKSINSYKIEELIVLRDKLGIKLNDDISNKKLTKKSLYDEIFLHF